MMRLAVDVAPVHCSHWEWAAKWFGDDVCELRDKMGLMIGLVSVVLWAVAEIPQLVVNAIEGSSDGLSEGLLWLWVFSDVLDVVGCSISDTLPTMLITAWMYFIFTLLLLAQHIYYTHYRPTAPETGQVSDSKQPLLKYDDLDVDDDLLTDLQDPSGLHYGCSQRNNTKQQTHTVYGSLRNLSIRRSSSSCSLSVVDTSRRLHHSFVHRFQPRQLAPAVLAGPERPPTADAATIRSLRTASLPHAYRGTAAVGKMAAGLTLLAVAAVVSSGTSSNSQAAAGVLGQGNAAAEGEFLGISYAVWGAVMGWTMAVTFFLGRIPQVIKNWQRQSCAGLSLEMFLVVFSAAVTYCASILIRVRSWSDLKPKLPFLVDAAAGAFLDLVILVQFMIYKDVDDEGQVDAGQPCCSRADQRKLLKQHNSNGFQDSDYLDGPQRALKEKLAVLQSTPNGLSNDVQGLEDVAVLNSLDMIDDHIQTVAADGDDVGRPSLDILDSNTQGAEAHVDILVIDGQQSGTDALSTSWNEDALSMLSVATV